MTKYRRQGVLNQHLFLIVLKGRKSKIKETTVSVSGKGKPASWFIVSSAHDVTWQKEEGISLGSLCKGTSTIHECSPLRANHHPPANTIMMGLRNLTYEHSIYTFRALHLLSFVFHSLHIYVYKLDLIFF